MEIKPGYKQTELGIIPEDWNVAPLSSITSDIGDGIHTTPSYCQSGNYYFINGNNIRNGYIVVTGETKTVSYSEFKKHGKNLNNRSILMSINGTIGNVGLFAGEPIVLGKSAAYLNVNAEFETKYVYYSLQTGLVKRCFSDGLTGTTIKNLGLTTIRNTYIPLPPTKAEQEAIAEALSDADTLIESLQQLIAKKRAMKQGAMQELLRPKEGWAGNLLGEISTIEKGYQLHSGESSVMGSFAYLNGGTAPSGYTQKANAPANTIAISEGGNSCGYVQLMAESFWCGGHCYTVTPKGVDNCFLYHLLKSQQNLIMALRVGSGLPNVQKSALKNFNVFIPNSLPKQEAIASTLSDMDSEIAALEARLAKARQIKQGMMQELLTGRIRLV